mgnify:CR=1 FL=1
MITALFVVPALFWWVSTRLAQADSLPWIKAGIFLAGLLAVVGAIVAGCYALVGAILTH